MFESSLTNQSVCSSKSITHDVGRSFDVEIIIYDNLDVASGSKSVTLRYRIVRSKF